MIRIRTYIAALILLGIAVPAFASDVPNGSFEDTSGGTAWITAIPNWTADPIPASGQNRVGVFYIVNGYSATQGNTFGAITTEGETTQTIRSSAFTIDNIEIQFDWIYATKNTPGDTQFLDPFSVTLMTSAGDTVFLVADADTDDLLLGTIGTGPFLFGNTYDSGWRTFTIPVDQYVGQTAQLEFTVTTTGGDSSGAFIDNITQVPEPGTIFLFGAGFLGLTAYGRRRLRAKRG